MELFVSLFRTKTRSSIELNGGTHVSIVADKFLWNLWLSVSLRAKFQGSV